MINIFEYIGNKFGLYPVRFSVETDMTLEEVKAYFKELSQKEKTSFRKRIKPSASKEKPFFLYLKQVGFELVQNQAYHDADSISKVIHVIMKYNVYKKEHSVYFTCSESSKKLGIVRSHFFVVFLFFALSICMLGSFQGSVFLILYGIISVLWSLFILKITYSGYKRDVQRIKNHIFQLLKDENIEIKEEHLYKYKPWFFLSTN